MKKSHQSGTRNPILAPLPLFAMIGSTAATIVIAFFVFTRPAHIASASSAPRVQYVCETCGLPNLFTSPKENKAELYKNNAANFRPVIVRLSEGRYRHNIETERLLIREVTMNDLEAVHRFYTKVENSASATWTMHTSIEQTRNEITKIIKKYQLGRAAHWAICNKATGEFMGLGGYFEFSPAHHRASMGWGFDSSFWGNGYATELGRALVEYGMKYLGFNRIRSLVRVDNFASRKVLEKIGMTCTTCFRAYWRLKGELLSHYQYVILKKDILPQLSKSRI